MVINPLIKCPECGMSFSARTNVPNCWLLHTDYQHAFAMRCQSQAPDIGAAGCNALLGIVIGMRHEQVNSVTTLELGPDDNIGRNHKPL